MSNQSELDYAAIKAEACALLDSGKHEPDDLAHVIWYPDGTLYGLSTVLPYNTDLAGHTARYYTLLQLAEGAASC